MAQGASGPFQTIAHLGGGGLSEVSLARASGGEPSLVVVKRLKLGGDAEPTVLSAFVDEARLCTRLVHPNIVRALEASTDADGPFLVLEYLEGQTLARIGSRARRRGTGVPRALALFIVKEILAGLAYAHALTGDDGKPLKVIHRDVSPENVVVTYAGTTKLVDFGVALAQATATKRRAVVLEGSVAYMAPEEGRTGVAVDARADIFSVGVVLWELLAGKRMWEGMSEGDVIARLADEVPIPSVRTVAKDVPSALDAVCTQALAKIRDDRFESAAEMLEALTKVAAAPGLSATTTDVASFVTELFADDREKMRALVDAALAGTSGAAPSPPRLAGAGAAPARGFVDVESDPMLWAGVAPAQGQAPAPAPARVEVVRIETPSRDRRFVYAIGGAVLIAFAVVAVVALRTPKEDTTQTPPLPPGPATRPRPTTTEPAASSAFVEPEEVKIDILVRPLTAHLFVDGVKVPNPHHVKVAPGKYHHTIRAEADGYEPRTLSDVLFDRDHSFDIALEPKPFVPPPRPHVPAPPASPAPPVPANPP